MTLEDQAAGTFLPVHQEMADCHRREPEPEPLATLTAGTPGPTRQADKRSCAWSARHRRALPVRPARPLGPQRSVQALHVMIGDMDEFSWPDSDAGHAARVRAAWSAACQALPVGSAITGEVTGRQRSGVFLRIDAHPDAIGRVDITTMPKDAILPAMGERVAGEVIDHADHNHQIKAKLTGCPSSTGSDAASPENLYRELAAHTFVSLWWTRELFDQTLARLREQRFAVVEVDASEWTTAADLHQDIATALDFPDYYGRNLDALNECIGDVVRGEYGIPTDAAGFVLALIHYDRFTRECPREAHGVLDILADHGRSAAVFGQRVLCLVHTDDRAIAIEPVGATHVEWNQAEWQLHHSQRVGRRAAHAD